MRGKGRSASLTICCIFGLMVSLVMVSHGMSETVAGQLDISLTGPDQVEVRPQAPRPEDNVTITLHKYLTAGFDANTTVSLNGTLIDITIVLTQGEGAFIAVMLNYYFDIPLGQLDHGKYIVNITTIFPRIQGPEVVYNQSGSLYIANHYVDPLGAHGYPRIQKALDNASDGDFIRVFAGTYHENLTINKNVSIVGNGTDSTVVVSKGMTVHSPKVAFSDISFTVENIIIKKAKGDGGGEGGEAGNGSEDGIFREIRHMNLLEFLIATLLMLFILLGFVVRKEILE